MDNEVGFQFATLCWQQDGCFVLSCEFLQEKHVACEAEYVNLDPAASGSRVQIFEGAISFGSCFYMQYKIWRNLENFSIWFKVLIWERLQNLCPFCECLNFNRVILTGCLVQACLGKAIAFGGIVPGLRHLGIRNVDEEAIFMPGNEIGRPISLVIDEIRKFWIECPAAILIHFDLFCGWKPCVAFTLVPKASVNNWLFCYLFVFSALIIWTDCLDGPKPVHETCESTGRIRYRVDRSETKVHAAENSFSSMYGPMDSTQVSLPLSC